MGQKFAMVSEWMDHGNINEFIRGHEKVNRVQLVSRHASLSNTDMNFSKSW